ncbi:Golgi transport complex subunit 4 [Entophlyctis luteolus]|nr:Golgi transport complex subunit 4 [Entophlyctis luteolus]
MQLDAHLAKTCRSQQQALPALMRRCNDNSARPTIALLQSHTKSMHGVIADTAEMADRISRKVRILDLDQQRVRRVLGLLDDLCEVRDSAVQAQAALDAHDWELAAIHVQRFLKHDVARIRRVYNKYKPLQSPSSATAQQQAGKFPIEDDLRDSDGFSNRQNVDRSDLFCAPNMPNPIDTLVSTKQHLVATITKEFEDAVKANNKAAVLRFFKLFAVVGESALGLDKFATVLASGVKRLAQDLMRENFDNGGTVNASFFAVAITRLFESVAAIIDEQEVTVERYYGQGRLLRVIVRLQSEMDVQTGILLDSFEERRMITRKVADINASSTIASTNRQSSTASATNLNLLDPREIDAIISEIAMISARTRLFVRFLEVRANNEEEKIFALQEAGEVGSPGSAGYGQPPGGSLQSPVSPAAVTNTNKDRQQASTRPAELEGVFLNRSSGLARRVQEILSNYPILQEFYLKKSIDMALKLDKYEPDAQTSSSVEDVFYLVKNSIFRTMSTGDPLTFCTVVESIGRIIESEYISFIQKRVSGATAGAFETKDGKANILTQISLNNLDISCEYIQRLVKEVDSEIPRVFAGASAAELEKMKICLKSLSDSGVSFKKMLMTAVDNIFVQMIKPKIRPTLLDCFKDIKYVLTEDEYVDADAQDLFMKRFTREFSRLISIYKTTYSPRNLNQTVSTMIDAIVGEWDRQLFAAQKFNALGALRFDKDLRAVTSFLTSLTTWSVRDKFVRLNNACALLNVEGLGEVSEIVGVSAGWRLGSGDVKKVLALRVDFNAGDIGQLKL